MQSRILRALCAIVVALLTGCATNVRFAGDELPSGSITGEKVCEVPQHWKALALQGVDTRSLTKATVVQVRIPPEWIGDALGWFVEGEETRTVEQYPRFTWQALVIDQRGKQQFFPAIMKNPLTSPVLTIIIPLGRGMPAGEEVDVYVPSGAYTKLLTTTGEMLRLPKAKDCLGLVDAEFVRSFPSRARVLEASESLLASIRADFPKPSLQDDGLVYSHSVLGLNKQVVGDLRQVTQGERIAERGMSVAIPSVIGTAISVTMALASTGNDEYVGPFGERSYSAGEANVALGRYLRGYNTLKNDLEYQLGIPSSPDVPSNLNYSGRKSGWEVGEEVVPRVKALWESLNHLKERFLRSKAKGVTAMKEAIQSGLLPSSPPQTSTRRSP